MLSPVWQVRQCIVRGQVSINILCLHKTMLLTIFLGLCPWLKSLGSPVCSFLVFMRQNPSRSGSKVEMNEPQVWKMEALHPSGQFIPVCGMNIHALVLFFLGACPFIYIGCAPNERMEYLLKYIQTLAAQQGNVVEKSHLALL